MSKTAQSHAKAFDMHVLQPWGGKGQFRGRRSGEAADQGVGTEADTVLGAWSCCRSIHPNAKGCAVATGCNTASVKCAQCGVFFNPVDNLRSMAGQSSNCAYHGKEPKAVGPYGEPEWPCCGAIGLSHSKYHSHSGGKASEYIDHGSARFVPWGCKRGFHVASSAPATDMPAALQQGSNAQVPLEESQWKLHVLNSHDFPASSFDSDCSKVPQALGRALARHNLLTGGNIVAKHPSVALINPWKRLLVLSGAPLKASRADIVGWLAGRAGVRVSDLSKSAPVDVRAAATKAIGVIALWPAVHDDMSRQMALGHVDAGELATCDARLDGAYSPPGQARGASMSAHGSVPWGTALHERHDVMSSASRRQDNAWAVHPAAADGSWVLEVADPICAQALLGGKQAGPNNDLFGRVPQLSELTYETLVLAEHADGRRVLLDTLLPAKHNSAHAGAGGCHLGDLICKLSARIMDGACTFAPYAPTTEAGEHASSAQRREADACVRRLLVTSQAICQQGVATTGRQMRYGHGVASACTRCTGESSITREVHTSDGALVRVETTGCRFHPGFWCASLRVRQILIHKPAPIVSPVRSQKMQLQARESALHEYLASGTKAGRAGHAPGLEHRDVVLGKTKRKPLYTPGDARIRPGVEVNDDEESQPPWPSEPTTGNSPGVPGRPPRPSPVSRHLPYRRPASSKLEMPSSAVSSPGFEFDTKPPPRIPPRNPPTRMKKAKPPRATTPPPLATQGVWYSAPSDAFALPAARSTLEPLPAGCLFEEHAIVEHPTASLPVPPPFDVPIPVYPPEPIPTPWKWLHAIVAADTARPPPPLLLAPVHTSRKALEGAQTRAPASAASTTKGELSAAVTRIVMPAQLPTFHTGPQGAAQSREWNAPGVIWIQPAPMLMPPLPPKLKGAVNAVVGDEPVYLPVDDHHRIRRMYPVIHLPVKNRSDQPVTVTVWQHFAETHPALDFHREQAWGYRLLLPDDVSHTFRPGSVTTVTLAAADPNFLSKTMMAPVSLHWRAPTLQEHALLHSALPRRKWLHDRNPPGMPTPGSSPGNPLRVLMPPPATPMNQNTAALLSAAVHSAAGDVRAARSTARVTVGRASQHAQALWDDEATMAGTGGSLLAGNMTAAVEHDMASALGAKTGVYPVGVSDLALSRHPAFRPKYLLPPGATSVHTAAAALHWAKPRDHTMNAHVTITGDATLKQPIVARPTSAPRMSLAQRSAAYGKEPVMRRGNTVGWRAKTHKRLQEEQDAFYAGQLQMQGGVGAATPPRRPSAQRPSSAASRSSPVRKSRKLRPKSAKARKARHTNAAPMQAQDDVAAEIHGLPPAGLLPRQWAAAPHDEAPVSSLQVPSLAGAPSSKRPTPQQQKQPDALPAGQAFFDDFYAKHEASEKQWAVLESMQQQHGQQGQLHFTPQGADPRQQRTPYTGASEPNME